jgi:glycine C-acetyltransferase
MLPIDRLAGSLRQNGVCRFMDAVVKRFPDSFMKDMVVTGMGPGRLMELNGQRVVNFGSDSFLGLDRDPRLTEAIQRGIEKWGTHNGTSRFFTSVSSNAEAEERLAHWLGTEAALIYPSVTLANHGAIPGLVGREDVLVIDEHGHNSIHEGAKIAASNGTRTAIFHHCDPSDLSQTLRGMRPYRHALVAIDGVYSMSGTLPPLRDLHTVCLEHDAVLYVDDAHGTGVLGDHGRGTVLDGIGSYANTLVAGSLSKAFSCMGGFIGCPAGMLDLLKMCSNPHIFGGPVAPPYLEAICTVLDILESDEYGLLQACLHANVRQFVDGARSLGLAVQGGLTPIISILVGDKGHTFQAGRFLFDHGYYVQSVTFPAVPYGAGVLRVQINANHEPDAIAGLLEALGELCNVIPLPSPDTTNQRRKIA